MCRLTGQLAYWDEKHITGCTERLLEAQAIAQRSKLGCLHLHYSSVPRCGRGGDTLVNTAQTQLPPRLVASLSFTYAFEHLPGLCVTPARRKICSKRVSLPAPSSISSCLSPLSSNFFHDTFNFHRASICLRCSNIEHTSSSTATNPTRLPPSPWLPSRFSSLPRSPVSSSLTTLPMIASTHCRFSVAQANIIRSRLCRSSYRDRHRDCVRHAWRACPYSPRGSLLRGASTSACSSGHFARVHGDCSSERSSCQHCHGRPTCSSCGDWCPACCGSACRRPFCRRPSCRPLLRRSPLIRCGSLVRHQDLYCVSFWYDHSPLLHGYRYSFIFVD